MQARRHSSPPVSLHGQLLWREFFYTVASITPQFDKMEGNDVCLQVPWDDNKEYLKAWSEVFIGHKIAYKIWLSSFHIFFIFQREELAIPLLMLS